MRNDKFFLFLFLFLFLLVLPIVSPQDINNENKETINYLKVIKLLNGSYQTDKLFFSCYNSSQIIEEVIFIGIANYPQSLFLDYITDDYIYYPNSTFKKIAYISVNFKISEDNIFNPLNSDYLTFYYTLKCKDINTNATSYRDYVYNLKIYNQYNSYFLAEKKEFSLINSVILLILSGYLIFFNIYLLFNSLINDDKTFNNLKYLVYLLSILFINTLIYYLYLRFFYSNTFFDLIITLSTIEFYLIVISFFIYIFKFFTSEIKRVYQ